MVFSILKSEKHGGGRNSAAVCGFVFSVSSQTKQVRKGVEDLVPETDDALPEALMGLAAPFAAAVAGGFAYECFVHNNPPLPQRTGCLPQGLFNYSIKHQQNLQNN